MWGRTQFNIRPMAYPRLLGGAGTLGRDAFIDLSQHGAAQADRCQRDETALQRHLGHKNAETITPLICVSEKLWFLKPRAAWHTYPLAPHNEGPLGGVRGGRPADLFLRDIRSELSPSGRNLWLRSCAKYLLITTTTTTYIYYIDVHSIC